MPDNPFVRTGVGKPRKPPTKNAVGEWVRTDSNGLIGTWSWTPGEPEGPWRETVFESRKPYAAPTFAGESARALASKEGE